MSISDKITSITGHLQEDYKSIENLGIDLTNIDKNIENIAECVNQIYEDYPKTEFQEGTSITLSNCKKGKLDFEDGIVGYGDTKQAIIPSEYQQVEYIEATSGQYIDTGTKLSNNSKVELTSIVTSVTESSTPIFGFRDSTNQNNDKFAIWVSNAYKIAFNYGTIDTGFTEDTFKANEKNTIIMSSEGFYYNGTKLDNTSSNTFTNSLSATIFAIKQANNTTQVLIRNPQMKVYSCKIWQSNILVNNFIPCYRISDNVIGMYDTVSKTFFTNAGTGTFTKGANAPTPSTPIDVQVVTGEQEAVVSGINKCSNSSEINESIVNADTSVIAYASVKPNTKYTIALIKTRVAGVTIGNSGLWSVSNITAYNENTQLDTIKGHIINGFSSGSVQVIDTYTTPSNCTRITVNPCNDNSDMNYNTKVTNIMILEGEYTEQTLPTYEPYQTPQTYQLSLGEYEFAKIGNYVDTIEYDVDEDKVYKNKAIGKYQFTGNENWAFDSATYNRIYISSIIINPSPLFPSTNDEIPALLCTNLKVLSGTSFLGDTTKTGVTLTSNGTFSIRNTVKTSLEQYKTWLSTDKPKLYYALRTAVKEEITGALKDQIKALYYSQSFTGTTIIESNGDLPMIIKVRALKGN